MLYRAGRTSTYPEEPVDSGIRFHFLGGAGEVGNVGCVIEDQSGTKVLMDYGLAPTKPPKYPSEAPLIDHAIITHSHIDHIGMAPWLVGHHGTTLHGSRLTSGLSEIMWRDTYKVSSIEGYPLAWDRRDLDADSKHGKNMIWTRSSQSVLGMPSSTSRVISQGQS